MPHVGIKTGEGRTETKAAVVSAWQSPSSVNEEKKILNSYFYKFFIQIIHFEINYAVLYFDIDCKFE